MQTKDTKHSTFLSLTLLSVSLSEDSAPRTALGYQATRIQSKKCVREREKERERERENA